MRERGREREREGERIRKRERERMRERERIRERERLCVAKLDIEKPSDLMMRLDLRN